MLNIAMYNGVTKAVLDIPTSEQLLKSIEGLIDQLSPVIGNNEVTIEGGIPGMVSIISGHNETEIKLDDDGILTVDSFLKSLKEVQHESEPLIIRDGAGMLFIAQLPSLEFTQTSSRHTNEIEYLSITLTI